MGRAAVVVAALLISAPAHAEDPRIREGRAAYASQHQERTVAILEPALASMTDHDRAVALRLVGCAHMVLGEPDAAEAAFRASFALEPDAALEPRLAASPSARELFEGARGKWRVALIAEMEQYAADIGRIRLDVTAPANAQGGRPLAIAVDLADATHLVSRVELAFRRRGEAEFTTMIERAGTIARYQFTIPSDVTESPRPFALEYHVTARHRTGIDLRRVGDPDRPRVVDIAAGHRPRWHDSWWARGAIAVGIVGLGAGGYFFYRSLDVGPQRVVIR